MASTKLFNKFLHLGGVVKRHPRGVFAFIEITGIFLLAFVLRLVHLNQSFWLDEAAQALESQVSFWKQWYLPIDFHPPLFHYIINLWIRLGKDEWFLRLPSVFAGAFSPILLYFLAKRLIDKKWALLASFFLAISPFHIYYSQELRPYCLSCFLGLASMLFFIQWIRKEKSLLPLLIVNILGLYTLYFFPFLMVAQLVTVFLLKRKELFSFLKSVLFSFFAFFPFLPIFLIQVKNGLSWARTSSSWVEAVSTPFFKSPVLVLAKFFLGRISFENKIFYGLTIFVLALVFIFLLKKAFRNKKTFVFLTSWFFIPIFLSLLISTFLPIIEPKRLLIILPAFYLLIVLGVKSFTQRHVKVFLISLIILISFHGIYKYWTDPKMQREQWRQAVKFVENNAWENSLVLFEFSTPFAPWQWYQKGKVEAEGVSENGKDIDKKLFILTKDKSQIFLFQYLFELTDPEKKVEKWLEENSYSLVKTTDFPGVGFIYEYIKKS